MKQKKIETLLYSAVGVIVMFVVIVAVNLIAGATKARLDLTQDKLYTLSPGTKAILKKLDSPVEVRFYFSQSGTRVPSNIRTYANDVEDLLEEFSQASGGKIKVRRIDPKPDSDAEEAAQADGIEGQQTGPFGGENFYFGLALSLDPEKAVVPLAVERERLLEYDIARALGQVISTNKPVLGVMTPLPMFGQPMNPMMMRMGQQGQRPWVVIQELKRDYNVRQIQMDVDKIDDDIQVLIVAHPKNISDKAQFALDQFVLRGGRMLAFLDATSFFDRDQQPNNPLAGMMPTAGSSLPKLLSTWGLTFETAKVVADLSFTRTLALGPREQPQPRPTFLFVNPDGINREDALTSQIDNLLLIEAGAFGGAPATGLQQTVLLHTTKKSQLVESMTARMQPQKTMDDFKPSGTEQPLALRLKGKFKTAFPEGKPAEAPADGEKKDEKKDEKKPADGSLKESKTESVVILVGDVDMLNDQVCFDPQMLQFGIANPVNGNFGLAQNLIEQLTGDVNLVGTRSRGAVRRPFTRVQKMEAEASEQYQGKIAKLNEELQAAQQQLNEMQSKKAPGQKQFLSPEQQQKITEFRKKERDTQRELREVRKNLRQEIDSLENGLKWANIAAVPGLVIALGLGVFFIRKQRTKAQ